MPRMDGMELLLRMRLSPSMREVPVIMLSASPEEDMNYRGLSLGATRFVYKPYRTALLREMADQLLAMEQKEVVIEPGSIDEVVLSRSQALDSGIIVLTPTAEGTLSTAYFTPAYARFCGYTVQEYESLIASGTDLAVTIADGHFDSFRMSVGMIAEEKMPISFYLHIQRQDRQLLTLSCVGQYFGMESDWEYSFIDITALLTKEGESDDRDAMVMMLDKIAEDQGEEAVSKETQALCELRVTRYIEPKGENSKAITDYAMQDEVLYAIKYQDQWYLMYS